MAVLNQHETEEAGVIHLYSTRLDSRLEPTIHEEPRLDNKFELTLLKRPRVFVF